MASSLICVIAQRLVRRICPDCREHVTPTEDDLWNLKQIKLDLDQFEGGKLWQGKGCPSCYNTGYVDRCGIYEMLPVDEALKDQIVERTTSGTIKRSSVERGCRTLRMDGSRKVLRGITTAKEVLRVTQLDSF